MGRKTQAPQHADAAIIERLGGSTLAAQLLGIKGSHAAQRVSNWRTRGIPAAVKLANYKLLVKHASKGGAA
jgi:hypothetical protein